MNRINLVQRNLETLEINKNVVKSISLRIIDDNLPYCLIQQNHLKNMPVVMTFLAQ